MWGYPDLRAALGGLPDMGDAEAAEVLSAQASAHIRDVPTAEARGMLLASGEWGGIVLLSRATPSAEAPDVLIAAAITAIDTLSLTETLDTTDAVVWLSVQQMLAGLVWAGAVTPATAAALLALRTVALPIWAPPPSEHDIAAARALEI